jgi:putative glutamine amidotransferase
MNAKRILYAGDTSLGGAAAYLAGILTRAGLAFDYVADDEPLSSHLAESEPSLYIISDYPVKNIAPADFATLVAAVRGGVGLLMIGGWESFHGIEGEYPGTPLAEVLPVEMQSTDDRVNSAQPCLVERVADHVIVDGLPFDRPPGIGGYNRVTAKPGAETILAARHVAVAAEQGGDGAVSYVFTPGEAAPLLVLGLFGNGRTAALATDVAPHWVGGFVDWGDARVTAQAPGAGDIEVGSWYAEFFTRLVRWTMGDL